MSVNDEDDDYGTNYDWCESVNPFEDALESSTIQGSTRDDDNGHYNEVGNSLERTSGTRNNIDEEEAGNFYFDIPPQLHPACSIGMRRVTSCYFSLGPDNNHQSVTDLLACAESKDTDGNSNNNFESRNYLQEYDHDSSVDDIFSHDTMMQILTYFDRPSFCAFSLTSRRSNFEVFYYLQLQLQNSLHVRNITPVMNNDYYSLILSRLAKHDMDKAQLILRQYQDSNNTLRMPLSYSLAYVRNYLSHNGLFSSRCSDDSNNSSTDNSSDINSNNKSNINTSSSSHTLARAALFMTVVGAASLLSSSDASLTSVMTEMIDNKFRSGESLLPITLFRFGFVGSLMKAAREISTKARTPSKTVIVDDDRQQQQQQKHTLHSEPKELLKEQNIMFPSLFEMKRVLEDMLSILAVKQEKERQEILFDPYDHLPSSKNKIVKKENTDDEEQYEEGNNEFDDDNDQKDNTDVSGSRRKVPSGCVGAYHVAVNAAANYITEQLKDARSSKFESLSAEDQRERSNEFLAACTSNDSIDRVKKLILTMDVDRFFVNNDGSETCALHTASFHGADEVVNFLCTGIDHVNSTHDGGLCDVNIRDSNGWTALHFAAGANAVPVVRALCKHGGSVSLNTEAHSGYSPLQWAVRLSNEQVAKELRTLMIGTSKDNGKWIPSQPLTSIANRFLSLIPTQ